MDALHGAVALLNLSYLCLFAWGLYARRPDRAALPEDGDRRALLLLGFLAALHFLIIKPLLPHNIWHEQHAAAMIEDVRAGLGAGGLDEIHGPTYSNLLGALNAATFGAFSVYSLNYAVSLACVLAFFLTARVLSGEPRVALYAAGLLLFSPVHTRLAATETMFITAEFFLISGLGLFALYLKTKRRDFFLLGLLAAVLLAQTRAEMMAIGLLSYGLYFALIGGRPALRKLKEPALLGAVASAALLCAPRVAELLLYADERASRLLPASGWAHFSELGFTGLNAFFNPEYTPAHYMLLAALGVFALRRTPRLLGYLAGHAAFAGYLYAIHLFCVSLKVRTALGTHFAFVLCAAYGLKLLGERFKAGPVLFAVALIGAPVAQRSFLTKLYTQQQEHAFLREAAPRLPEDSVVVYLAQEDDEDSLQNRDYQRLLLKTRAYPIGIWDFLETSHHVDLNGVYFYRGIDCRTRIWRRNAPPPRGKRPGYEHPLCRRMFEHYELKPVRTALVGSESLSWDGIEGASAEIGFYRVGRRPARARALASLRLPPAREFYDRRRPAAPSPLDRRISLAQSAGRLLGKRVELSLLMSAESLAGESPEDAGRLLNAFEDLGGPAAALAPSRRLLGAHPGDRALLYRRALLLQSAGKHPAAVEVFDRLLAERPGDARLLSDRGVARALAGDYAGGRADLEAALATGRAPESAAKTLEAIRRMRRAGSDRE